MTDQVNDPTNTNKRRRIAWWGWTLIAAVPIALVCGGGMFLLGQELEPVTTNPPASDSIISNSDNEENPPVDDVSLTSCETDEFGYAVATLQVINNSSKASDYSITVEIVDGDGNRLEEAFTFIEALRPDQSAEVEALGLEDVSDASGVECVLLTVDRYSSEG